MSENSPQIVSTLLPEHSLVRRPHAIRDQQEMLLEQIRRNFSIIDGKIAPKVDRYAPTKAEESVVERLCNVWGYTLLAGPRGRQSRNPTGPEVELVRPDKTSTVTTLHAVKLEPLPKKGER